MRSRLADVPMLPSTSWSARVTVGARIGKVLCVADLTENGRAVRITFQGRPSLALTGGSGHPIERNGRLDVFAWRPTSPPAVDHGWQGTMCG